MALQRCSPQQGVAGGPDQAGSTAGAIETDLGQTTGRQAPFALGHTDEAHRHADHQCRRRGSSGHQIQQALQGRRGAADQHDRPGPLGPWANTGKRNPSISDGSRTAGAAR